MLKSDTLMSRDGPGRLLVDLLKILCRRSPVGPSRRPLPPDGRTPRRAGEGNRFRAVEVTSPPGIATADGTRASPVVPPREGKHGEALSLCLTRHPARVPA